MLDRMMIKRRYGFREESGERWRGIGFTIPKKKKRRLSIIGESLNDRYQG